MSDFFSPPEVAERLGIDAHKVLGWIDSGELTAVNIAARVDGRPRWRVSAEALEQFLARRQQQPKTKTQRKKRQAVPADWVTYF